MRWPKMTGTLISRENFSMNGTQTPAGVRSLLTGTLLGVKPMSKLKRLTPS